MKNYAEMLFIDVVRDLQNEAGTGKTYAKAYQKRTNEALTDQEIAFIAERDSFYIASVSSRGWPYIQHRGGPRGFLKILDEDLLGFGDYVGNKQFITMGHVAQDDKVSLFLMDYENSARLKIMGRMTMIHSQDADPELREQLVTEGQAQVDRIATIKVESVDWNCPKYIPQLINAKKIIPEFQQLLQENEALKQQIESLKAAK